MSVKLLDCILGTGMRTSCLKNGFNCAIKSQVSCIGKARFCSKSDEDDLQNSELRIKELLNRSSPLRPELGSLSGTYPYDRGTIYQEMNLTNKTSNSAETSIILFPGQGNQFVGMARNLLKYPVAVRLFNAASEILNYDLLKVCIEGPAEKLDQTEYCQPATVVCCLALLEKLKDEKPWAISNCVGTCGYSLGEITALTFAGSLSFESAVQLVKVRAKAMQLCSDLTPGGMMTVIYGLKNNMTGALADAVEHCKSVGIEEPHCSVASYLFPNCKVIGGNIEALNFIISNADKYGIIKMSKLKVSGAFHTDLMKNAVEPFQKKLKKIEIREPIIQVYSSVTGKGYNSIENIKKTLTRQLYSPIKWQQVLNFMYERKRGLDFPVTYECGPGISLTTSLRKVNAQAAKTCFPVKL